MSLDRLLEGIEKFQNPTVAGLDPMLSYIPTFLQEEAYGKYGRKLEGAASALYAFNRGLIDALCPYVPAVKLQCAYYEMYGWPGVHALQRTAAYARKKGMFVIIDGKRNDIGSTMEAYAAGHLGKAKVMGRGYYPFHGDALTVNGYLGSDGIHPLLETCRDEDAGIFVLVKTSNLSSGELQDQLLQNGEPLYLAMGKMCEKWGESLPGKYGYSGVGAVVGATYPQQMEQLRKDLPHTFFLVPGYGAQGGTAESVALAFDSRGLGAVVNSSRAIMCAWQKEHCREEEYADAARREALRMRDQIMAHVGKITLK